MTDQNQWRVVDVNGDFSLVRADRVELTDGFFVFFEKRDVIAMFNAAFTKSVVRVD